MRNTTQVRIVNLPLTPAAMNGSSGALMASLETAGITKLLAKVLPVPKEFYVDRSFE